MVNGSLHDVVSAWEKPKTSENNPPPTKNTPGRSNGSWSTPSSFFNQSEAPVMAIAAKTRLTKRVQRQEAYEVRMPPRRSPRAPPAPAMAP